MDDNITRGVILLIEIGIGFLINYWLYKIVTKGIDE